MDNVTVALALAMTQQVEAPKAERRSVLPVVPEAVDVTRRVSPGATSVEYDVLESYPAPKTIAYLIEAMAHRGWKVSEVGTFRPPQWTLVGPIKPSPRNLQGILRATPVRSHIWVGWWRDPAGRGVTLDLAYYCPMEEQGLHSVWLHVRGSLYSPEEAARQYAERKRVHDALCQAVREGDLPPEPTCVK
jgi:hypothetical protein